MFQSEIERQVLTKEAKCSLNQYVIRAETFVTSGLSVIVEADDLLRNCFISQ